MTCEGITFLMTGAVPLKWKEQTKNDVLAVSSHVLCSHLVTEVFKLYGLINSWEEKLKQAILDKKSLNDLCQIACTFFQNPLMVHNLDFEVLGIGEYGDYQYAYKIYEPNTDYLVQEVVDMLVTDPDYPSTFKHTTPQLFYDKWDLLYMNVFIDGSYVARIVVDSVEGNYLTECDFYPLFIFSKYVQNHLQFHPASIYRYLASFKGQLAESIRSPKTYEKGIPLYTLERLKWDPHSRYLCMYIVSDQRARSSGSIEFQCGLLENTFNNCIAFSSDDHMICVMNLDVHQGNMEMNRNKIMQFLRDQIMHAGISDIFTDFQKLPFYYEQAREAYLYGEESENPGWGHVFSDIRLGYVLHHGIYSLSADALLPYEIHKLIEHDKEHNGHLVETLKVYVEEQGNIQESISRMYIHRSTFNYRFAKIKEIITDSLMDSPDKWLYLSLVLRLV